MPEALVLDVSFTVRTRIDRAPAEVFDALVDPQALCSYYTATASGPILPSARVHWTWQNGDEAVVDVADVVDVSRIVLRWNASLIDEITTVTLSLTPEDDGSTGVTVHETGWRSDPAHLASAFSHCSEWQHMLICLKAWLEHGIDLRP